MYQKEWKEVVEELNSNIKGLSKEEALKRLKENGRIII